MVWQQMLIFPFLFYVEQEHLSGGSGSNVSYHLITQIGGIQLDASGIEPGPFHLACQSTIAHSPQQPLFGKCIYCQNVQF